MTVSASELNSCIYEGVVFHRRHLEHNHAFTYRLFQMYLDLDELDDVFRGRWLWSTRRIAIARFRREDHFGDPELSLSESVRKLVKDKTGKDLQGPIRLLTHLRYCGFVMNPVSFYFCFDAADEHLDCIVAEVHNTPWGECHCYVLEWPNAESSTAEFTIPKDFHVSPFLPMDMTYRWKVSLPNSKLSLQICNFRENQKAFEAELCLDRISLSSWNLNTRLLRFPLMTTKVVAAIYWQALKLWWKRTTYYPHPKPGDQKLN